MFTLFRIWPVAVTLWTRVHPSPGTANFRHGGCRLDLCYGVWAVGVSVASGTGAQSGGVVDNTGIPARIALLSLSV